MIPSTLKNEKPYLTNTDANHALSLDFALFYIDTSTEAAATEKAWIEEVGLEAEADLERTWHMIETLNAENTQQAVTDTGIDTSSASLESEESPVDNPNMTPETTNDSEFDAAPDYARIIDDNVDNGIGLDEYRYGFVTGLSSEEMGNDLYLASEPETTALINNIAPDYTQVIDDSATDVAMPMAKRALFTSVETQYNDSDLIPDAYTETTDNSLIPSGIDPITGGANFSAPSLFLDYSITFAPEITFCYMPVQLIDTFVFDTAQFISLDEALSSDAEIAEDGSIAELSTATPVIQQIDFYTEDAIDDNNDIIDTDLDATTDNSDMATPEAFTLTPVSDEPISFILNEDNSSIAPENVSDLSFSWVMPHYSLCCMAVLPPLFLQNTISPTFINETPINPELVELIGQSLEPAQII
jgi:hypothetical protein